VRTKEWEKYFVPSPLMIGGAEGQLITHAGEKLEVKWNWV